MLISFRLAVEICAVLTFTFSVLIATGLWLCAMADGDTPVWVRLFMVFMTIWALCFMWS